MQGNTALHHAASNGLLPVVELFIRLHSCDPTIVNHVSYGLTYAIFYKHTMYNITTPIPTLPVLATPKQCVTNTKQSKANVPV